GTLRKPRHLHAAEEHRSSDQRAGLHAADEEVVSPATRPLAAKRRMQAEGHGLPGHRPPLRPDHGSGLHLLLQGRPGFVTQGASCTMPESHTIWPSTMVSSLVVPGIRPNGTVNRSCERTARSANWPGARRR